VELVDCPPVAAVSLVEAHGDSGFAVCQAKGLRLLHCRLTGPDAGLEGPALGDPAQEATQRRLFMAASSDGPTDFAAAQAKGLGSVDKSREMG